MQTIHTNITTYNKHQEFRSLDWANPWLTALSKNDYSLAGEVIWNNDLLVQFMCILNCKHGACLFTKPIFNTECYS